MKRNIFSHRPCFVLSFVLLLLLIVLCPPPPASAQPLGATLARYSEHFQQEKIHLHFDKAGYNKGETIWYKAYLMAGFDPSDYSRNLYIDWYDPAGKLLKHEAAPIFEASARGQFDIPAGYTAGFLHVKAYTKWMLNFDSAFLFNKNIPVVQTTAGSPLPRTGPPEKPVSSLQFFPEGGDLVNGLLSRVAFKAVNSFGLPVKIRGVVRSGSGDLVDSLTTEHDGMGSFFLQPADGELYTGSWTDESGNIYMTPLPTAKKTGATLQVQPHTAKSLVVIKRSEPSPENLRTVYVIAHMNQSLIYQAAVNLSARSSAITEIPTDTLPTGVLQITLFDANWVPLAERVAFVNNNRHLFPVEVNTLERSPEKRGKNVIGLEIPDSSLSNLSVSVTDAGLATESNTIVSQLLLCGDIKGTIYHPSYYFSTDNTRTALHLDLVMMTHGWRRFNWPDIVRGKDPILPYARDTDYLHIEGKFFSQGLKLLPDQKLMVVLQSKDSSRQRLLLPVRPDGSFSQSGVSFFDTLKVYYQLLGNKKAMEASALTMRDGLLATPKNAAPFQSGPVDTTGWWRSRYFAQEQQKLDRLAKGTTLADVIVSAKARRPVDLLDEKYATGLFKRPGDYQFDMINDPWAKNSINVFEFLKQMVPGLQVQFRDGIPVLNWRGGSPSLFLDETGMRAEMINDVPVADIAYVKVYRPPFYGAIGGGRGGAIAIYTRKGGDVQPVTAKGLEYKLLEGYTPYRQFYSPDYSQPVTGDLPDIRTTLYWNPLILTEPATHSVKLEFYNNDTSKRLRIVVEGMNAAGKLCRVEKVID
ncbi:MAG TPA: hypothetical protein VL832_01830 [Puia sp.]|nr:hypothetical protein [Puia sp.]